MSQNSAKPDIAVIIPCYNARNTISKTLDSVLSQTFDRFKIYIVNDGSTDDTPDILSQYQKKHPEKIHVISQQNQGQAIARNAGIQTSTQTYIAFIDSDDLWHPEKLAGQIALFKKDKNAGMCYTPGVKIDEQDKEIGIIPVNPLYQGRCFQHLIHSNNIVASSVMVKRSVLDHVGIFDTRFKACENWDLWLRIVQAFSICYLDEPLTYYRIHSGNMSQNSDKIYENRRKVLEKHLLNSQDKTKPEHLTASVFNEHHRLYGLRLVEELRLSEARQEFIKALHYKFGDMQSHKMFFKTLLGKTVFLQVRKLKKSIRP